MSRPLTRLRLGDAAICVRSRVALPGQAAERERRVHGHALVVNAQGNKQHERGQALNAAVEVPTHRVEACDMLKPPLGRFGAWPNYVAALNPLPSEPFEIVEHSAEE